MNPFDLTASDLLIWGVVLHLIADWPLQNDWMARNKAKVGHPAGMVHAGIHYVLLAVVFGWWAGLALGVVHYLIDLRKPVSWWSRLMRQTQPGPPAFWRPRGMGYDHELGPKIDDGSLLVDVGTEVRFWTDQVFHIACIAVAALVIA